MLSLRHVLFSLVQRVGHSHGVYICDDILVRVTPGNLVYDMFYTFGVGLLNYGKNHNGDYFIGQSSVSRTHARTHARTHSVSIMSDCFFESLTHQQSSWRGRETDSTPSAKASCVFTVCVVDREGLVLHVTTSPETLEEWGGEEGALYQSLNTLPPPP